MYQQIENDVSVRTQKTTTGLLADRLATDFLSFFSMADKTETPKKEVGKSSKCFVGSSPSATNERVFIFGNSRLILLK